MFSRLGAAIMMALAGARAGAAGPAGKPVAKAPRLLVPRMLPYMAGRFSPYKPRVSQKKRRLIARRCA